MIRGVVRGVTSTGMRENVQVEEDETPKVKLHPASLPGLPMYMVLV